MDGKVYDCFPFFNELDLLEIRLRELNPVVDVFVLSESIYTFQLQQKPLFFQENKDRFAEFLPKIRHVVVDKKPSWWRKLRKPTGMDVDNFQKDFVAQQLYDLQPQDMVIIGDVDEIPSRAAVAHAQAEPAPCYVFAQRFYHYFLNFQLYSFPQMHFSLNENGDTLWHGTVAVRGEHFRSFRTARKLRNLNPRLPHPIPTQVLPNAGWHFSSLGGAEQVLEKLKAWTHADDVNYDYSQLDLAFVERAIAEGRDVFQREGYAYRTVPASENMPHAVAEDPQRYAHLLRG